MTNVAWTLTAGTARLLVLVAGLAVSVTCASVSAQDRLHPPGLGFTRDFERIYPDGYVYALASHDDGSGRKLYAGGEVDFVNGQLQFMSLGILRWDGEIWSRVSWGVYAAGSGLEHPVRPGVHCFQEFDDGTGSKLYVGGEFNRYWSSQTNTYESCDGIVTWDGVELQPLYQAPPFLSVYRVHDMVVYDDGSGPALYLAGRNNGYLHRYSSQGVQPVGGWLVMNAPFDPELHQLAIHDDGSGEKLYVAGYIERVFATGSTTQFSVANGLAVWDGAEWTPILGPWPAELGTLGTRLEGRMVSYDDGSGPALYMGVRATLYRYRAGVWETLIPYHPQAFSIRVLCVYDDGTGPALYVTSDNLRIPGVPPGEYVQFAKYQNGVWHALGENSTILQWARPANCAAVIDLGEGPDLYTGINSGGQTAGGQHPISMARYRGVHRDVAPVCGGDGSLMSCPCGPRGMVGRGCPNSAQSRGALLAATGGPAADTLRLTASDLPPSAATLLLQGNDYDFSPRFVGNGVLCTSGTVARLALHGAVGGTTTFPAAGGPSLRARAAAHGDALPPGSVRYYQAWYRDAGASFCGGNATVNVTNGMRVVW